MSPTNRHNSSDYESIAKLMSLLADPTRLILLHLLKQKPACVSEVVKRTGLKQPNVSKHLSLLYQAHLIHRERNGNQIRYSIGDPFVFDLCSLVCRKLHREAELQVQAMRERAEQVPSTYGD